MHEFDLPVARHMVAGISTLQHTERLTRAAQMLEELGVSALPVLDGNRRLGGVLERADLLRMGRLRARPAEGESRWWWPDVSVAECMQTSVAVTSVTQPLRECAQRMLDRNLHRVYVLTDNVLAGVLSTRELMLAVAKAQVDTPLEELAAGVAETIEAAAPLSAAIERFSAGSGGALVVVSGGEPIGVFGQPEFRACLEAEPNLPTQLYMDGCIVALPADLAADRAVPHAVAARARYIIATDASRRYRVVSGLSFAGCVCGQRPATPSGALDAVRVVPVVSVAVPEFRTHAGEADARGISRPAPVVAPVVSAELRPIERPEPEPPPREPRLPPERE